MKKYITVVNIVFFLWGIVYILISEFFRDYVRGYLYLSIGVIIPFMIWDLIKKRKKDKIEGTKDLYNSINRMMIMAVVLVVFFVITKQNHL
ncbi:hypothetical protein [Flavobacterium phragmitis]|uniref:Uncharacterized protein n=1 Tax=Flavobacterium phragmitis TaxID=739143 RepID=A0A1I1W408_9FLAO|nr:hypothetical protein [Flavobacterium phragmitis]SFD89895.1 hypothetical protein SAMN05216297_11471 [Flavobacterium phragmitis]